MACIAGILLNLLFSSLVDSSGLPLYLDTVGTISVAVMGGYLPGVLVGFATNFLKGISNPSSLYYGFLQVLIAIFAAYLGKRGDLKKKRGIAGAIIIFSLIGGAASTFIPFFMEGLVEYQNESLCALLYKTGHFNLILSKLISSIIIDLLDKAASVFIVLIILHFIPKNFYKYAHLRMWMQNPVEDKDVVKKEKKHVRVMSLQIKTLVVLIFSLTTVAFVGIYICIRIYHNTIISDHTNLARGTVKLAASVIDGDKVNEYLGRKGIVFGYDNTKVRLKNILESTSEISYLYVYKMEEDGFHVVFDIDTEDAEASEIGEVLPYGAEFEQYIPSLLAGEEVEPIITNDEYGYLLTAACPVFDSRGDCVCYAIADVDMEMLQANESNFITKMVTIYLGFFIFLCVFIIWLVDYHIIVPVRTITNHVDDFSEISDTQEEMDEYLRELRQMNVHTGDEIESLYKAICRMTQDQVEQTRSIRQLSNSTSKMQEGLIITMADMVENRDSDTGAHIQKTAAYVQIIVEGLKKKGYYAEKITPEFISDVVRSAPLHDVGKINIPDVVLNKPGKLTDEEYEIMKTHTTAGKLIMEHVISTVEGESYLKEARNMAAYHHERWDGKGYPEGLHGEEIPLSARIMAVADVFDALTSPRVYKPAFPLKKALDIIEEGSGTQFDEKCVEVFMANLDKVTYVLRKYNGD